MMARRMLSLVALCVWTSAALAAGGTVVLSVPGDLPAPAEFGVSQLREELTAKGMQLETAAKDAVLTIKIESGGSASGLAVPDKPECFAIVLVTISTMRFQIRLG